MRRRIMITVLDSINQTTMPYNEFILYRNKHYQDEQQVLILTGNEILIPTTQIPKELDIHKCGKNPYRIRKELKLIVNKARANNQEIIIHLHSIRGAFSAFIAMIGLGLRKSTIYSIHSTFPGFRIHNKIFCALDVLMARWVTSVSYTSYTKFPSILKRIKGSRMQPLQNGVNEERVDRIISEQDKTERLSDSVEFVYVARIIPLKYHRFLVNVLADIPEELNVKFLFIGKDDEGKNIKAYAEEKGVIDRIEFTGILPREQVYARLYQSDVYISSSTLEGLPISVLEGMYCGLPAILSDIPQHKEVAQNCNSVFILPFDVRIWSDTIKELYYMTIEQRKALGMESREYVGANFSLKRMHEAYDIIYKGIEHL